MDSYQGKVTGRGKVMVTVNKFYLIMALLLTFTVLYSNPWQQYQTPKSTFLTFSYTPSQLETIKGLAEPDSLITLNNLKEISKEVFYLIDSTELSGTDKTMIPAYLANAQKDFAFLSYLLSGELKGHLGPVTLWTLQLFMPKASLTSISVGDFDVYSSIIAALVVNQAANRLKAERNQIADYSIKQGEGLWTPTSPGYRGLDYGSIKTWYLTSSKEFMAKTPPNDRDFWKKQSMEVLQEQKNLNGEKVQAVFWWAGLTAVDAGNWEKILNDYLEEKQIPLIPRLYLRAHLLSSLVDSTATTFNSKYSFWIMRPSQTNGEVKPLIIVPNHPSYPSAHSTNASTASVILSEFFPEDTTKWNQLAEESGMSRIWGGIHYPVDNRAGLDLGKEIGKKILQRVSEKESSSTGSNG
jgi:hypothetical protein